MELAIINSQLAIKSIPEETLNNVIMGDFLDWVCNTLSIKEDSIDKVYHALPAIKKHCWSMGFVEIKKMLTMYADGELSIKPTSNHFDRIRLGEVMSAYRQQKPKAKILQIENTISEEEKLKILKNGVIRVYKEFLKDEIVPNGSGHIYDTLYELKLLPPHTKEYRDAVKKIAIRTLTKDAKKTGTTSEVKHALKEIKNNRGGIKGKCKEIILNQFFTDCKQRNVNLENLIKTYTNNKH
jgi:hypothetical protein